MSRPNEKDQRRPKIEDVAREAGVSIMSVSRAIRGVDGVSPRTRAEILRIAKRLGYQPSRVAGSLATTHSNLIGVSVPTLFDAVFAEIFDGMRDIFIHAGMETIIETNEYNPARETAWIERMVAWTPAGVILTGVDHSDGARERLAAARIPVLEIWDVDPNPIDLCVGIDHRAAGLDMGRHLALLGYRSPAYVGVPHGRDPRAEKRIAGLRDAFGEVGANLAPEIRVDGSPSFESGRLGAKQALEQAVPRPDVICFLNDHMAFGGMMACEAQGLEIPGKIGIVGFNGLNINAVLPKRLTTSITPRKLMGATGARQLVARILGATTERLVQMPVELMAGETTRPRLSSS